MDTRKYNLAARAAALAVAVMAAGAGLWAQPRPGGGPGGRGASRPIPEWVQRKMGAIAPASVPVYGQLAKIRKWKKLTQVDRDHALVEYQFEPDADGSNPKIPKVEPVTPAAQAARRARLAVEAWKLRDPSWPIAVLNRSPYGGGECKDSYWPAGIKSEHLAVVVENLARRGVRVETPGLEIAVTQPATATATAPAAAPAPAPRLLLPGEASPGSLLEGLAPVTPSDAPAPDAPVGRSPPAPTTTSRPRGVPTDSFGQDYEFVLVVGLHHEALPYHGVRSHEAGKTIYSRTSRLNAWAVLFHTPTGCAFWGAYASTRVGYGTANDPVSAGAAAALSSLSFETLGADNLGQIALRMPQLDGANLLDLAAVLIHSQRADAVEAAMKAAMAKGAFTNKIDVLRHFNAKGTPLDYRTDPTDAEKAGSLASQQIIMRFPLLEQLRAMRSLQGCVLAAQVPLVDDIELGLLGKQYLTQRGPMGPDDEVVLLAELVQDRPETSIFAQANVAVAAVRQLGRCRTYIDEAIAVCMWIIERPDPPPGSRQPRDPLKDPAQAALGELNQAKTEQQEADARRRLAENRPLLNP